MHEWNLVVILNTKVLQNSVVTYLRWYDNIYDGYTGWVKKQSPIYFTVFDNKQHKVYLFAHLINLMLLHYPGKN